MGDTSFHEFELELDVDGNRIAGSVRANYAEMDVCLRNACLGVKRRINLRTYTYAFAVSRNPEYGLVLNGRLTPRGEEKAKQLMADIFLDYHAVSANRDAVVERLSAWTGCKLADEQLLTKECESPRAEIDALRKALRAGEITNSEYQKSTAPMRVRIKELNFAHSGRLAELDREVEAWSVSKFGRGISRANLQSVLRAIDGVSSSAQKTSQG